MGNSHPHEPSFLLDARSIEDWVKVQEQGYCQLWVNKKTKQLLQAYPIPQSFARNQDQLHKYNFRRTHRQNLVVVEGILTPGNSAFCSEPRTAYALVQNITARLSEFKNSLNFQQALYVLSAAAAGYNTLNSFFGPLQPNADMICFNEQGEVKVWLNQNLALNEPSKSSKSSNPPSDDYSIAQKRTKQGVNKLIKIVEQASINQFGVPFSEECKKVSTYFEAANMVSYFCYAHNIELPLNIIVLKNLKNPPVNLQKMMNKHQSYNSFKVNPASLDSSRIKTVLFKSSQVQQREVIPHLINPPVFRPLPEQQSVKINYSPRVPPNIAQSPKITFNNRSTLPAQLSQQKAEGVLFGKQAFKTSVSTSDFLNPRIMMRSLQEPKVHIKLQEIRRNVPVTEPTINDNQKKQVVYQQQKPFRVTDLVVAEKESQPKIKANQNAAIENVQIQTKVEPLSTVQQINGQQHMSKTQEAGVIPQNLHQKEQINHDISHHVGENFHIFHGHREPQRFSQADHHQNQIKQTSYLYQPQEDNHYYQSKRQEQRENYQEQRQVKIHSKASAIEELKNFVHQYDLAHHEQQIYPYSQQNLDHYSEQKITEKDQPYYKSKHQENIVQETQIDNSTYSNIEKYTVPPTHLRYQQSPIIEQLEENFSSPPKDHTEIQEWEARLTKFTQSRHSQLNEPESKNYESQKVSDKAYAPSVQFKRQAVYKEQVKEQGLANELANLDQNGIEEYIRKKYNLGGNQNSTHQEKPQPVQRASTKEKSFYFNEPERISYDYARTNDEAEYSQPRSSYRSNKYETNIESWKTKDYAKDAYQKQNYYPKYQYPSNNHISVDQSQPQIYQNRYLYQEDNYTRKQAEKPRYRTNEMSKIDERYNKYVVNASKPRQNSQANIYSMSKDVSMILGGAGVESKISRFSPKPVIPQLQESTKRGYDLLGDYMAVPAAKNDVTYQKLRNLLWSE